MKKITKISDLKAEVTVLKSQGKRIGFVPTMGCMHEGHLSLIRESLKQCDCTVVSIFVNPTQFGPKEDFHKYPRDLKRDFEILKAEGVDYLFVPEINEMYPEGYKTYVEVYGLQDKLYGRSRPGHFKGVCTVVLKLLNIVSPDISYFGQKDAQQAILLKRMARDLNLDGKIEILPIVRDKDGLALSSRNKYLSEDKRISALSLSRSLRGAEKMIHRGERDSARIIRRMREIINSTPHTKIDYVQIVDTENLNPVSIIENEVLIAVAVFVDKVRLIDNMIMRIKE